MAEQNRRKIRSLAASRSPSCVGIDLVGVEHRETGVAVLRDGRPELLTSAGPDEVALALAALAGPGGVVAVNAPLPQEEFKSVVELLDLPPCTNPAIQRLVDHVMAIVQVAGQPRGLHGHFQVAGGIRRKSLMLSIPPCRGISRLGFIREG